MLALIRDQKGSVLMSKCNADNTTWVLRDGKFYNLEPITLGPAERDGEAISMQLVAGGVTMTKGELMQKHKLKKGDRLCIAPGMCCINVYEGD